jgi:hypothetical protein
MEFAPVPRTAAMAVAHANVHVLRAAALVEKHSTPAFIDLLVRTLYEAPLGPAAIGFLLGTSIPKDVVDAGVELARECSALAQMTDKVMRARCRGALLEEVVERLVRRRVADVRVEQAVKGLNARIYKEGQSKAMDVVACGGPVEVYECKAAVVSRDASDGWIWHVNQDDLTEFGAIAEVAAAEGDTLLCAIATFDDRTTLGDGLEGLQAPVDIYAATRDDLDQLAARAPDFLVIKAAS